MQNPVCRSKLRNCQNIDDSGSYIIWQCSGFMKGDFEEGKEVFEHYLQRLKDSFYSGDYYIEWHEQFYNYCN